LKKTKPDPAFSHLKKLLCVNSPKGALVAAKQQSMEQEMPKKGPPLSPESHFKSISKAAYGKTLDEH